MAQSVPGSSTGPRALENVAILGLGVIGAFTALAVLQRAPSTHVTVYELRDAPTTIGGALNISPNAHRDMAKFGVAPSRYGALTPKVLFQNEKGERVGEFVYGGSGDRFANGFSGMRAQRSDILDDLIKALRPYEAEGRLRIVFGKRATSIDETSTDVRVTFNDGEVATSDLLIGADGIHSFTRGQIVRQQTRESSSPSEKTALVQAEAGTLAKPKATYSGITTIYGLVPTSALDPALLAPLEQHHSIRTISPHAGLFAIAYAREDHSTVHWFSSRNPRIPPSPDVPDPSPEAVRDELLDSYGSFPSPLPELIKATEDIYYWPVYRLSPLPETWSGEHGRIVLVGDSAHALPPFAAQGIGMGVEDGMIVANVIAKLACQSSDKLVQPSAKLWKREYQAKRAPRVAHYVRHAEAQGRARMDSLTIVGRAREWGLWFAFPLINALSWVHGRRGVASSLLSAFGLGDVQGWGYDPDDEIVNLEGL